MYLLEVFDRIAVERLLVHPENESSNVKDVLAVHLVLFTPNLKVDAATRYDRFFLDADEKRLVVFHVNQSKLNQLVVKLKVDQRVSLHVPLHILHAFVLLLHFDPLVDDSL